MNNINKIEQLLDKYIENNKNKKMKHKSNEEIIELYKQLFMHLDGNYNSMSENIVVIAILFNLIYKDDTYFNKFNSLLNRININKKYEEELKEFIRQIKEEYYQLIYSNNLLLKEIERSKEIIASACRIKESFNNKTKINEELNDTNCLKRLLSYFEVEGVIDKKEKIILINEIEFYNRGISINIKNNNEREYQRFNSHYRKIPNILNAGFQEHDKIYVSSGKIKMLNNFAQTIIETTKKLNIDDTIASIESYRSYNLSDNEYNYIIVKLLDYYLDDLLLYYHFLLDKEIDTSKEEIENIVESYYRILDRYLYLREYYEKINEVYIDENAEIDSQIMLNKNNPKKLIFTHSNVDISKARIISDMDDVPYEYYDKISSLLYGFINSELTKNEIKPFTTNDKKMTNFFELRNDQIRIIMKHIKNDIYCVMGVFVKKSDNLKKVYNQMASRPIPDINSEDRINLYLQLSDKVLEEFDLKVRTFSRKGTRYKCRYLQYLYFLLYIFFKIIYL